MTKKGQKIIIIVIVVLVAIIGFLVIARLITGEDTWICSNGEWVKHGQPSAAKPTSGCGNVNTNLSNSNSDANTNSSENTNSTAGSFDACVLAGNPVQESYPRRCAMNGQTYTEDIGNELEKADLITITSPRPNAIVTSPMSVSGQAKGTWFFEGVFPVKLTDENNNVLAETQAQASGDWMTENFVEYTATLTYTTPLSGKLYMILSKANPSGLAANADELKIPLKLSSD
ncbi:MAG: Gmad2 immunoglobulin-like domain-containing protein [Patescibacteria group bacterium]